MTDPDHPGIYAIRHLESGKVYVGSAVSVGKRWSGHRRLLRADKHPNRHLMAAWRKHGEAAFSFNVIEVVEQVGSLIEREQHWIDRLSPFGKRGYNLAPKAGSNLGVKFSPEVCQKFRESALKRPPEHVKRLIEAGRNPLPETRAKLSAARRGKKDSPETIAKRRAAMLGTRRSAESEAKRKATWGTFSPERLKRIYDVSRGKPRTPEVRAKISVSHRGITPSPEVRAKFSEARRRENLSPETRAKMSAAQSRRTHSAETRAKMVASRTGLVASPETRIKISQAASRREAAKRLATRTHQPLLPFSEAP